MGFFGVLYNPANPGQEAVSWDVSEEGMLSFPPRGEPVFTVQEIDDVYAQDLHSSGPADSLKLLTFESKGDKIQALLRIPASSSPLPGIVLLPGTGVSKEKEQKLAVELSELGYATLALDQRKSGGIPGVVNPEKDLELFRAGLEPLEYKMAYDALKAVDVLAAQTEIDPERLAVLGESNGGRFAVLACALEPSLNGVIGISTSGYGTGEIDPSQVADPEAYRFYRSIDPDTYLSSLPPARFVLMHSFNDTVIPHELAVRTFALAEEPKAIYNVSEAAHGYTASMHPYLEEELALMLKEKGAGSV
ncbi:alpha/beta hydrolase [Methanosarcina sp. KYL-1]|nr:alpha/beta hydrolase [Methanosarcina sp. KYL-1]